MSRETPKPKANIGPGGASSAAKRSGPATDGATGRVKFDDRGNAIWEWQTGTGVFGTEPSTQRLEKLEVSGLSLVEDSPSPLETVKRNPLGTVKGYSPYDSGVLAKTEVRKKKDLRKLSEWLKLKKQASNNKHDD